MSDGKYFTREGLEKVARGAGIFASHLFLPGYSTYRLRRRMQEIDKQFELGGVPYTPEDRRTTNRLVAAFLLNDVGIPAYVAVSLIFHHVSLQDAIILATSRTLQGMSEWRLNRLEKRYRMLGESSGGDESSEGSATEPNPISKSLVAQYKSAEA